MIELHNPSMMVITPNNRLSKQWLEDHYRQQGLHVSEKPLCFPYQTFLSYLFHQLQHGSSQQPMLLTPLQERYLWQQVLQKEGADALLDDLHEAWTRCHHWQLDLNHPRFQDTPTTQFFQRCARDITQQLRQHHALTSAEVVNHVLQHMHELSWPSSMLWLAFDDFTPQQKALQAALEMRGCLQKHENPMPQQGQTWHYAAHDEHDEQMQMIHWIRDRLKAHDTCIGVVVPNLHATVTTLQRLFQRHLPQHTVNFSLGKALGTFSLVAHAMCWLRLNKNTVTQHELSLLLHSPYLGGSAKEFKQRAMFIQNKHTAQENILPFSWLLSHLEQKTPLLYALLQTMTDYPKKASPMAWAEHFKTRLKHLGFPGDYSQNSETYQCFQRFMSLFDALMPLTALTPEIDLETALNALNTLSQSTLFQAKALPDTSVHVLGLLEASGCRFDSVWVQGLTDLCLPQKTHPSPFIPLGLQRDHHMPHAVPEREAYLAKQTLHRLHQCAQHTVFSYPSFIGDHPQLPSPLIIDWPLWTPMPYLDSTTPSKLLPYPHDHKVPCDDITTLSGGTALLMHQAQCPFRAFAAHRLHAQQAPEPIDGLSLGERGQLVHQIMEHVWRTLKTQACLLAYSKTELEAQIIPIIEKTLQQAAQQRPLSFPLLMQDVEKKRLLTLSIACLDLEKQRPAFVVEALEETFQITLAALTLTVRIDRLDRLDSQKKWIIDYKTSLPRYQRWDDEPLENPQLPLYALLDPDINTVLFMQLKTGNVTWQGLSEDDHPGMTSCNPDRTWDEQRNIWRSQLTHAAQAFLDGACEPQPLRPSTCTTCEFQSLCRVDLLS